MSQRPSFKPRAASASTSGRMPAPFAALGYISVFGVGRPYESVRIWPSRLLQPCPEASGQQVACREAACRPGSVANLIKHKVRVAVLRHVSLREQALLKRSRSCRYVSSPNAVTKKRRACMKSADCNSTLSLTAPPQPL